MLLRAPAEIPAPVAIALSDFCRRAGRPSSAEEVRTALARLSPDEDRNVRKLCKGEPPATPLSPHAVIDVLRGRPAADAARLEEQGHYEAIAAEYAAQAAEAAGHAAVRPAPAAATETETETAPSPFAPSEDEQRARILAAVEAANGDGAVAADQLGMENEAALRKLAAKLGILDALATRLHEEKAGKAASAKKPAKKRASATIAPVRRPKAEVEARKAEKELEAAREEEPEPMPPPRPGRTPGQPLFGRFVGGPATKRPFRELMSGAGKEVLEELISELRGNRTALIQRIDTLYGREDGRPVAEKDLVRLLEKHGQEAWFARVEKENLKILLRQSRGHEPPVLHALGLTAGELTRLIERYDLAHDIRELKERTREEARADRPLAERIMLVAEKADVLADAGVLEDLERRNREELVAMIRQTAETTDTKEPTVLAELTRRSVAMEPRVWRKGLRRYKLVHEAAAILGVPPPVEEPRPARRPASEGEGHPAGVEGRRRPGFGPGNRMERQGPGFRRGPARGAGLSPAQGERRRPGGFGGERPFAPAPTGSDRPAFGERPFPPNRARMTGGDRPPARRGFEKSGEGFGDRPGRPARELGGAFDRPRRPAREGFGERPPRRPAGEGFGGRPAREGFGGRPAREGFGERPRRPAGAGFGERPRRPAGEGFGERPRRPAGEGFGERPRRPAGEGFGDRPRRPAGEGFGDRPRRPAGEGFGARPARPAREGFGARPAGERPARRGPPREGGRPAGPGGRGPRPGGPKGPKRG